MNTEEHQEKSVPEPNPEILWDFAIGKYIIPAMTPREISDEIFWERMRLRWHSERAGIHVHSTLFNCAL